MARTDDQHVIGIDFGTSSGRAVVVRACDGEERGRPRPRIRAPSWTVSWRTTASSLPAARALQDPDDDVEVLTTAVPEAAQNPAIDPNQVVGVATDFTACTIVPATADRTPLCRLDEFQDRPQTLQTIRDRISR
jgi:L-ribulokinase